MFKLEGMSKKKPRPTPVPAERIFPLFDAHTHLFSTAKKDRNRVNADGGLTGQAYAEAVTALMDRAEEAGIVGACTVGDGIAETERAVEAAHMDPRVWAAVAVHPTEAATVNDEVKRRLTELAHDPRCVAIGETGMDTYWIGKDDSTADIDTQEEIFRWHIELACATGKALMIHNREADEQIMRVLADSPEPPAVILHCFSSGIEVAEEAIERGYVLSFAGNTTFKRNEELREAAHRAPAEQILVETDAPYMTAEPFRGARNEPAFVGHTAKVIAEQRGISVQELARTVTANARRIYQIGK